MSNTPLFVDNYDLTATRITNTTETEIFDCPTDGSKILKITATNTSAVTIDATLVMRISATNYRLGVISIPAYAGAQDATAAVALLDDVISEAVQDTPNRFLVMENGASLRVTLSATPTSGQVDIVVEHGDY